MQDVETYEQILARMLSKVPNDLDKRPSSLIYVTSSACAAEMHRHKVEVQITKANSFPDTCLELSILKYHGEVPGVQHKEASKAIVKGVFRPAEFEIDIGTRFTTNELIYEITEKISPGTYKLICETPGTDANHNFGQLIPIDYLAGLQYGEITEVLIFGEDTEDLEHYRARVLAGYRDVQPSNGNFAAYKAMSKNIQGVGGVKIYRPNNDGGYIDMTIQNSEFGVPSQELIALVAQTIDPYNNHGNGVGEAGVDHHVTVIGVREATVDVSANFTFRTGYNFEELKPLIIESLNQYFAEENENWENYQNPYANPQIDGNILLKIAKAEAAIININGILNVENLKYNGVASSLLLGRDEIAKLGEVTNGT